MIQKPHLGIRAGWLLPVLLSFALPASLQAQFTFITTNGTVTITGYTGGGAVTIPGSINGYPVVSIEDGAFLNCTSLTNVTFGSGVTNIAPGAFTGCTSLTAITADTNNAVYSSLNGVLFDKSQTTLVIYPPGTVGSYVIPISVSSIGNEAFDYCPGLTGITISNNVTSIGVGAFEGCGKLTSVIIPNNVTNIGYAAFAVCRNLTAITVSTQNLFYCSANGVLFNQNQTILWEYPSGLAGSYAIPASVTNIGDYAFYYCPGLTNVIIGTNITSIGNCAFLSASLTSVTIPSSVTSIGDSAFASCTSLTNVTICNGVTSIGRGAFSSCPDLTSITIPNSVTSIGDDAFFFCSSLSSVTVPDSVTSIGASAFSSCDLTNVTIPNSVTNIGDEAFQACTSLTAITVSTQNLFYCSVDGVLFNKNQTYLMQYPPARVGSYTIPASVASIGSWAFNYCYGLTSVTIPNGVTNIGDHAFIYCTGLIGVTIPSSVTSIGSMAFAYCSGLASVLFQGNAPSIGNYPFSSDGPIIYYLPGTTGWGWFLSEVVSPRRALDRALSTHLEQHARLWCAN